MTDQKPDQVRRILHELIVAPMATRDEGIGPASGTRTLSKQHRIPAAFNGQEHRLFTIRAADENGHRSAARILVNRLYAERGYLTSRTPWPDETVALKSPEPAVTLVIQEHETVVGTLSVGVDGPQGLLVDELYAAEVQTLRDQGRKLCEFIKLGVDQIARSRRLLASLFHTAFLYAKEIHGCDHVVVEVNPRHVDFYRRILGFSTIGPERSNPRVDAPAVLMCLDLQHTKEQLEDTHRGNDGASAWIRAFYRSGFSDKEQEGIVRRMKDSLAHHGTAT